MSAASLIFCFPEAVRQLTTVFPDSVVLTFADTPEQCRQMIDTLDGAGHSRAWLLFKPLQSLDRNMPVRDHINLSGTNSLIGPVDTSKGPRFPDLSSVYEAADGMIAVLGKDPDLEHFQEPWCPVSAGIWEAIALKQRGYTLRAWLIADLEKWILDYGQNID